MNRGERIVSTCLRLLGPAVLILAAAGCGDSQLVKNPPPPVFGPRVPPSQVAVARPAPVPRAPVAQPPEPVPLHPQGRSVTSGSVPSAWQPPGPERNWQYIVVHHSDSEKGCAAAFDAAHKQRGWDELGYHFVIGNGTESGDGEVEIGPRWFKQKHGAHCKVTGHPEYNDVGIGICLVGNFDITHPTEAQMESLARLLRYLMARYNIPISHIYGHGQLKPTNCPGRHFDYADMRRRIQ